MALNSKIERFSVVVIDDKDICCDRICQKIQGNRTIAGRAVQVFAHPVHIKLQQRDADAWTFDVGVAKALSSAAESRPDMLVVDYIYIDALVRDEVLRLAEDGNATRETLAGKIKTPRDLRAWIETSEAVSDETRKTILRQIFDFSGPVYVHTFTPRGLGPAIGSSEERLNAASVAFPSASQSIHLIDTRATFFADDEFDDKPRLSLYNSDYYAFQLGVYFDQVVQKELYRRALDKSRYLRVKRTALSVTQLSAISGGVALVSSYVGSLIFQFAASGDVTAALLVGVLSLIVGALGGWALAIWFEAIMGNLLGSDKMSD